MTAYISFEDAADADRATVGGKGKGLGLLVRAGFRVPEGFVIPADISPADVIDVLRDRVGDDTRPYAYRSSAPTEDGEAASFAGQYRTVLNVVGVDAGAAATAAVRSSAADTAASAYRSRVALEDASMAVVVQRQIQARASGVAFSRDPVTGADVVVVEAVDGVGDALMSGEVTPESWIVDGAPERRGEREVDVLTENEAAEIARLCRDVAASLGGPHDVEWAIDIDGPWLLQARPITALPVEPTARPNPRSSWERADGFFPDPITPLMYTAWFPTHTRATGKAFEMLGIPSGGVAHGYFWGRVYDRVLPLVGGEADDRGLPADPVFKLVIRIHPTFRARLKRAARAASDDLPIRMIEEWEESGRARIRSRSRQLRAKDLSSLSDGELACHITEVRAHAFDCGLEHFKLAFGGWILAGQLGEAAERLADWKHDRVIDLVQGHGDATRAEGEALQRLCDTIADDPDAMAIVTGSGDLLTYSGRAGAEMREFLDEFGHRSHDSLTAPTWAEDPGPLVSLIRGKLAAAHGHTHTDPKGAAAMAVAELLSKVHDDADRARLRAAVERAQLGRPYGDETERDPLEAMGLIHYAVMEAGDRFVASGRIRTSTDVAFLEIDELQGALDGEPIDLDTIERRRAEHRWALSNPSPRTMGPKPGEAPRTELLPSATRPIIGAFLWAMENLFYTERYEADSEGSLRGLGASAGVREGFARVIRGHADFPRIRPGDIVVCPSTMASWSSIFSVIGGLVTEVGGPLSHPGTLAREFGLPAVLAVTDATTLIEDGARIRIDGARGTVTIVQETA